MAQRPSGSRREKVRWVNGGCLRVSTERGREGWGGEGEGRVGRGWWEGERGKEGGDGEWGEGVGGD